MERVSPDRSLVQLHGSVIHKTRRTHQPCAPIPGMHLSTVHASLNIRRLPGASPLRSPPPPCWPRQVGGGAELV